MIYDRYRSFQYKKKLLAYLAIAAPPLIDTQTVAASKILLPVKNSLFYVILVKIQVGGFFLALYKKALKAKLFKINGKFFLHKQGTK